MGQEHLSGALLGEAASKAVAGEKTTPRVGLSGVKASSLRLVLSGVKATPRVGLPGDKATSGDQGPWVLEGLSKTHTAVLGAKLQALIAAILLLSTPLPAFRVVKVEMKREVSIETSLTIIAPYPLPSRK